jgi:hypothetical protein
LISDGSFISIRTDSDSDIDLQTPDDGLAAATKRNEPKEDEREEEDEEKLDSDRNGLDSQWNKRMKERLERIKSKKLRDTVSLLYLQLLSFFLRSSLFLISLAFSLYLNMYMYTCVCVCVCVFVFRNI